MYIDLPLELEKWLDENKPKSRAAFIIQLLKQAKKQYEGKYEQQQQQQI